MSVLKHGRLAGLESATMLLMSCLRLIAGSGVPEGASGRRGGGGRGSPSWRARKYGPHPLALVAEDLPTTRLRGEKAGKREADAVSLEEPPSAPLLGVGGTSPITEPSHWSERAVFVRLASLPAAWSGAGRRSPRGEGLRTAPAVESRRPVRRAGSGGKESAGGVPPQARESAAEASEGDGRVEGEGGRNMAVEATCP